MAQSLEKEYKIAVLVDGSTLGPVYTDRFQGYDTSLYITDGKRWVPMSSVVYFGEPL